MRTLGKVFLIIVAALAVIVSGVCIWQRDNIAAVVKTFTTSEEEIKREMDEAKKKLEEELKSEHEGIISDFTAEEEAKIMTGEMTVDEAVEQLKKRYEDAQKAEGKSDKKTEKDSGKSSNKKTTGPEVDRLIAEKTVELYSLKAYYLGQLGQLEATVKSEYLKLPKEKRNLVGKQEIVARYMGKAVGLMNQCDSRVEGILTELQNGLKALGADVAVVGKIRSAYENEKNLKKSYYYSLLD